MHLQAWTGPLGSKTLKLSQFLDSRHLKKIRLPALRLHTPADTYLYYSFLLKAESTPGPECGRKDYVNNTIRNRTRDLQAGSALSLNKLVLKCEVA